MQSTDGIAEMQEHIDLLLQIAKHKTAMIKLHSHYSDLLNKLNSGEQFIRIKYPMTMQQYLDHAELQCDQLPPNQQLIIWMQYPEHQPDRHIRYLLIKYGRGITRTCAAFYDGRTNQFSDESGEIFNPNEIIRFAYL